MSTNESMDVQEARVNNASIFRECFSERIITSFVDEASQSSSRKKRNSTRKNSRETNVKQRQSRPEPETSNVEELAEFIEYLASEIFHELPEELQTLSWYAVQDDPKLKETYPEPLPIDIVTMITDSLSPSISDSLSSYGLIDDTIDLSLFLSPPLSAFISSATTPPSSAKHTEWASACEICERDWINLSYHHLIPREMHEKVVKRGWHPEYRLNDKASLCRQCHSMVHRIASNEELARDWYTVDLLRSREDVQKWAQWVGRVRWKAK